MKTPKKIWKSIAKKFKNSTAAKAKVSSREEANKPLEITIEHQPTVVTAKTTTAKDENSKKVHERPLTQQKKVITINPELKAKLVDDLVWEEECKDSLTIEHTPSIGDSEVADNQLIYEKSATALIETDVQEPNTPGSPSSAELYFDSKENSADEKSSIQPIVAGVVGAALLVSSTVACILKMYAIAVIVGIFGSACIGFVLYNVLKPDTKLEEVEDIEQPISFEPNVKYYTQKHQESKLISLEESLNY